MEKSIETIWKEGFVEDNALIAPKINALYNQNSVYLIDRIIRRMRLELRAIIPLGAFVCIMSTFAGNPLGWGLVSFAVFIVWFFIGKQQLNSIKNTKPSANCYLYLKEIKEKLHAITRYNERLNLISIPALLFPMLVYTYFNNPDKDLGQLLGIGANDVSRIWIFLMIPIMLLFAFVFYRAFVYFNSGFMDKIDSMLKDIETLKE